MDMDNQLSLGFSLFNDLISNHKIYVDKTYLVAKMARGHGPILFTRPKGFGKTTLVSTF